MSKNNQVTTSNIQKSVISVKTGLSKLFIGGIPHNTSEKELEAYFSNFGPIVLISLPVHKKSGKLRGFAFVEFEAPSDAKKALEAKSHVIRGKEMAVRQAISSKKASKMTKKLQNRKIFAKGFPLNTTEEQINQFFSQFGKVDRVLMGNSSSAKLGNFKGFAYIIMCSDESFQKVLEKSLINGNKLDYCGFPLKVYSSKTKEQVEKQIINSKQNKIKDKVGKSRCRGHNLLNQLGTSKNQIASQTLHLTEESEDNTLFREISFANLGNSNESTFSKNKSYDSCNQRSSILSKGTPQSNHHEKVESVKNCCQINDQFLRGERKVKSFSGSKRSNHRSCLSNCNEENGSQKKVIYGRFNEEEASGMVDQRNSNIRSQQQESIRVNNFNQIYSSNSGMMGNQSSHMIMGVTRMRNDNEHLRESDEEQFAQRDDINNLSSRSVYNDSIEEVSSENMDEAYYNRLLRSRRRRRTYSENFYDSDVEESSYTEENSNELTGANLIRRHNLIFRSQARPRRSTRQFRMLNNNFPTQEEFNNENSRYHQDMNYIAQITGGRFSTLNGRTPTERDHYGPQNGFGDNISDPTFMRDRYMQDVEGQEPTSEGRGRQYYGPNFLPGRNFYNNNSSTSPQNNMDIDEAVTSEQEEEGPSIEIKQTVTTKYVIKNNGVVYNGTINETNIWGSHPHQNYQEC